MEQRRFTDPQVRKEDLIDEPVLVVCPRCSACASVTPTRLVCTACTFVEERPNAHVSGWGGPYDPFFLQPLWLQADCGGHTLWAFHARHLDIIEEFVAAKLRERGHGDRGGLTMVARLPAWLTSAKHRDEVLRTISRLRAKLPA
jgi:hypothetical protein